MTPADPGNTFPLAWISSPFVYLGHLFQIIFDMLTRKSCENGTAVDTFLHSVVLPYRKVLKPIKHESHTARAHNVMSISPPPNLQNGPGTRCWSTHQKGTGSRSWSTPVRKDLGPEAEVLPPPPSTLVDGQTNVQTLPSRNAGGKYLKAVLVEWLWYFYPWWSHVLYTGLAIVRHKCNALTCVFLKHDKWSQCLW